MGRPTAFLPDKTAMVGILSRGGKQLYLDRFGVCSFSDKGESPRGWAYKCVAERARCAAPCQDQNPYFTGPPTQSPVRHWANHWSFGSLRQVTDMDTEGFSTVWPVHAGSVQQRQDAGVDKRATGAIHGFNEICYQLNTIYPKTN
ncbi:hypothetical protein VTK26DRAFT_5869 [Humicola hyalothermophila]